MIDAMTDIGNIVGGMPSGGSDGKKPSWAPAVFILTLVLFGGGYLLIGPGAKPVTPTFSTAGRFEPGETAFVEIIDRRRVGGDQVWVSFEGDPIEPKASGPCKVAFTLPDKEGSVAVQWFYKDADGEILTHSASWAVKRPAKVVAAYRWLNRPWGSK